MKVKLSLLMFFLLLTSLVAAEKVVMEDVLNRVDKDAIYMYDYCTGTYMKVKLNQDEAIECRDAQKVDLETLSKSPKVAKTEDCEEGPVQIINITNRNQTLEILDHSRGKRMIVEIGDDGILKCKDIKVIKKTE